MADSKKCWKFRKRIETMGISDNLFRILAEETDIEIKMARLKRGMRNLYPGYLFVEMNMTDEAWYVVRNTPGVTGFNGSSGGGAFFHEQEEIENILKRIGHKDAKVRVDFQIGDTVKIFRPFMGMEGVVEAMNDQAKVATVLTILFGRETPTDMEYNLLEKFKGV